MVRSNYSSRTLAEWLAALGSFDQITPQDAAALWNVPLKQALTRLHAMVGGPLVIPPDKVEIYRRAEWNPEPVVPVDRSNGTESKQADTLAHIPTNGIPACDLARVLGIADKSALQRLFRLHRQGLVEPVQIGTRKLWVKKEQI